MLKFQDSVTYLLKSEIYWCFCEKSSSSGAAVIPEGFTRCPAASLSGRALSCPVRALQPHLVTVLVARVSSPVVLQLSVPTGDLKSRVFPDLQV